MKTTPRIIISFAAVILSFFIFPHISSAQEFDPIPLGGSLDLYVGTWKYENAETNEVFIVKLKKFENYTTLGSNFGTVLIGEYYHYKNGIISYNNLDYVSTITTNDQAIRAPIRSFSINNDFNNLCLTVIDMTYYKATHGTLSFSLGKENTNSLRWKIEEEGDFDIGPDYIEGLSIPTEMTLIKID